MKTSLKSELMAFKGKVPTRSNIATENIVLEHVFGMQNIIRRKKDVTLKLCIF
jgi:hypothetical protein